MRGVFILMCVCAAASAQQPLPFSHKTHIATAKLQCKTCHPNPDPGDTMTIAAPPKCMQCHSAIKTDSPAIQKLAAFAKNDREIKWQRIYQTPSYVHFSHRSHTTAGTACETCHGPVAERDLLTKEVNLSMGACMACHQTKKVSIDCGFCHDQP